VTTDRPTFLYDGDCAFCSMCARFIERHIRTPARIVPYQSAALDELDVTEQAAEVAVQWVDPAGPWPWGRRLPSSPRSSVQTSPAPGPVGIARLLRSAAGVSGWLLWRPLGLLLGLRPVLVLAWPAYRWVSRNRHRLPGGTAACVLPRTTD
jgi:predicted DCC family thiol-disulfide oxidoreductase YuxK